MNFGTISSLYRQFNFRSISNQLDKLNIGKETLDELYILYIPDNSSIFGEEKRINLRSILIEELINQFHIEENYANEIITSFDYKIQHGLVSTCILMKEILKTHGLSYFTTDSYNLLKEAAIAILMHHFTPLEDRECLNINIKDVPMVVMLMLCDELQEWNRPLDDFGLDGFKGRLIYQFDNIESKELNGEYVFAITLNVEEDKNYTEQDVEKIIFKTLKDKNDRFNLIKSSETLDIDINVKICLTIKYKNKLIGEN